MARTTTYKKLGLPLGWWIFLSHKEACDWTSVPASEIRSFLIGLIPGPWSAVVSAAISVQSNFIRGKNEQSGKKGVKLLFLWATGVITSVERLGTGKSPCGGGGTGGGGAGPAGPRVPKRQN
jgi:hypothetical protein